MKSIGIGHQDQMLAVAYDFYGRRMATCSADHTIKVFDKVGETWHLNDSWRAHDAPIVKVSWAGPKHTPLIASGSHDCTVKLWEEFPEEPFLSGRRWRSKHTINDFKGPVYDVEFCSASTILKLAAIAGDGVLRIYETIDSSNIGYWTAMVEQPLLNRTVSRQLQSSFALSWSPTPSFREWIAVSVLDDALVFECDKASGKYIRVAELPGHRGLIRDISWAPSFGRSHGLIATACKDGNVRIFSIKCSYLGPMSKKTRKIGGTAVVGVEMDEVDDGKEAGSGKRQITWRTSKEAAKDEERKEWRTALEKKVEVKLVHDSSDHDGEVWRVCWNSSGSILASTGDDAKARFWKNMLMGSFKCMAVINGSQKNLNS